MKILLVDDHPLVLQGIAAALTARGHEMHTASDLAPAREALRAHPDIELLVLDLNLPSGSGIELLRAMAGALPAQVAILSGQLDPEDISYALFLGATAFVSKTIEPAALVAALEGLPGLPAGLRGACLWNERGSGFVHIHEVFSRASLLSAKEREVFMLLRQGLADKQIADRLSLSIHTVRVHARAIKRKRDFKRRAGKA
ncbi:MAG: response regulator transcription factor [Gammaproteobacteria bacterium]|nr:response regulator transcription factor [Gammaproteobacteria bacterium]